MFVHAALFAVQQCAEFDKEVLDGGSDLDPLLAQFITVRLTNAAAIDLRIFRLKDLRTWTFHGGAGFFLRRPRSMRSLAEKITSLKKTRISKEALIATVWRVLKHHYDPRRKSWDIDGPVPDLSGPRATLEKLPGWASWDRRPLQQRTPGLRSLATR